MEVSRSSQNQLLTDEDRFQNYIKEQRKHQIEQTNELDQNQSKDIEELRTAHAKQLEELKKGYDVEISKEAKLQDEKLKQQEHEFQDHLKLREKEHDTAFQKLDERERLRVEQYKRTQEEKITKIHDQFVNAEDQMNKRRT